MAIPPGGSGTGSPRAPLSRWPKRRTAISGSVRNLACFVPMALVSFAGNHRRGSSSPRPHTSARHARWHSLDWHVCRARELEQRQADPISRGRRSVHNIAARRSGGNGLGGGAGRSAGNPYRAAVRDSKRQHTMLRTGWRLRQFRLEFGRGQFRRSLGWRRIRSLALEARSAEALCGARNAACRPDSICRRPANRRDQRWRTQAGRWRQTRSLSDSQRHELQCDAAGPRDRCQ